MYRTYGPYSTYETCETCGTCGTDGTSGDHHASTDRGIAGGEEYVKAVGAATEDRR